jgi:O-antigen ligase
MEKPSTRILLDISLGLLVVFLVARLMISGLSQEAFMPSVNKVVEMFAALALASWILSILAARRLGYEKTGVRLPLLVFMVITVLSVAQASYAFPAAHAASSWVIHICAFFLVVNLSSDRRRYNVILTAVIATAIVVSVLSFYHYFYALERARELFREDPSAILIPDNLRTDFLGRLGLNEATGTFIQSNTFAGYLILVVPLVLFAAWGALRKHRENLAGTAVLILAAAATAGALYLSGSKGGWLGLLGGVVLFTGFYYLYRRPAGKLRKAKLNAVIAVAAFVILVAAVMLSVGYDKLPASVKVRLGYWDAAMRMIWHNPLGAGIANFQENYTIHQQPWATEVRSAHNSYLSIWAELSVAGLAAFVLILFLSGRRYFAALRRKKESSQAAEEQPGTPADRKLYLAMLLAGVAGFMLVALLSDFAGITFGGGASMLGLAAFLWVAVAASLLLHEQVLSPPLVTAGIALGLLAFACHAFIDFDFYSHGINATFWVLLGLLLSHCCRLERFRKAPSKVTRLGFAAAVLIVAVVLFFAVVYVPRALEADCQARNAGILREDAARADYEPELAKGAAEEFEKAQELSRWNARNCAYAAELYESAFFKTGKPEYASKAIENYSSVIKLRPNSQSAYSHRGHVRWCSGTKEGVAQAIADAQRAVALYPVNASHHFRLALYLERLALLSRPGEMEKHIARARGEFEEAWRLHNTVAYRRGKLSGQQLDGVKRRLGIK